MAKLGNELVLAVLAFSAAIYIVVLGIAGYAINNLIDGTLQSGNSATFAFVLLALISGVVGVASIIAGILHFYKGSKSDSLGAAVAAALIAMLLVLLTFGLACKEIAVGGDRNDKLETLEAFSIILVPVQLVYLLIVLGVFQ